MKEREIIKITEEEHGGVMRDCARRFHLLWLSTIPSGLLTFGVVKHRYGGWPVAIGSGVLASFLVNYSNAYAWKRCVQHKVFLSKVLTFGGKNISDQEIDIFEDCESDAFWKYSVPLMTLSACGTLAAISNGHLAPSSLFKLAPSAPKVTLGAAVGYLLGQRLWMANNDCLKR